MRKALIPGILLLIALILTGRAACSNRELIPFFGKWSGGFVVDSIRNGVDTPEERKRFDLMGWIQVYATGRSFKLHLEGEQETLDLGGVWASKGNRLILKVNKFEIDDFGGPELRDPNKKFIDPKLIREGYSRPIVLDMSPDKKRFIGQRISIGNLIGRHEFTKG